MLTKKGMSRKRGSVRGEGIREGEWHKIKTGMAERHEERAERGDGHVNYLWNKYCFHLLRKNELIH